MPDRENNTCSAYGWHAAIGAGSWQAIDRGVWRSASKGACCWKV